MRQLNRLIDEITRCAREGVPMIDDILAIQLHCYVQCVWLQLVK